VKGLLDAPKALLCRSAMLVKVLPKIQPTPDIQLL
jgi:hypothetical protein